MGVAAAGRTHTGSIITAGIVEGYISDNGCAFARQGTPFRCRRDGPAMGLADEVVGWGSRRAEEHLGTIQEVLGQSPEGFGCYQSVGHAWGSGKFRDWPFAGTSRPPPNLSSLPFVQLTCSSSRGSTETLEFRFG